MKVFIASDLHGDAGCIAEMLAAFEGERADALLLLGDYLYHGPRNAIPGQYDTVKSADILNKYVDKIIAISGNCDAQVDKMLLNFPFESLYMTFPTLNKKGEVVRVVATHGHLPVDYFNLQEGDVLLHGHTHVSCILKDEPYYELNPGSISIPKGGTERSYMVWKDYRFELKSLDGRLLGEVEI